MVENTAVKEKIDSFFKKDLKIYVCGDSEKRPADLFKQSSMMLLNNTAGERTVYAEPAMDQRGVVEVSFDAPKVGGELEKSITKSSRDFNELAQVLRELGNVTWVMDKDAILRTFAMDPNPNKTKQQAFEKHMEAFSKEEGYELTNQLDASDKQFLYQEVMGKKNNPFSLAISSTKLEGNVGVINPADADMPIHNMFYPYMKEKGISLEEYNQFINTHEAGHANDRRNHGRGNWERHRTESVADTFATLMLAKRTGNTEISRLAADIRNESTIQGLAYVQKYVDEQKQLEEEWKARQKQKGEEHKSSKQTSLREQLAKFADKDFEKRDYVGNPYLKEFMEQQSLAGGRKKLSYENQTSDFLRKHINRFDGASSSTPEFNSPEATLGMVIAYTTTPTVDATIKVADEKLKDGSLKKMSTKEIYSLAENLVDENTYSKDRIAVMISSFMKGESTPEFEGIIKRRENSNLTSTNNKKVQAQAMTSDQRREYDKRFKAKIKSDSKEAVIDAVETEKDRLRSIDPFTSTYKTATSKIEHLNAEYVDKKDNKEEVKARIEDIKARTLAKKAIAKENPSIANLVNNKKSR